MHLYKFCIGCALISVDSYTSLLMAFSYVFRHMPKGKTWKVIYIYIYDLKSASTTSKKLRGKLYIHATPCTKNLLHKHILTFGPV